MEWIPNRRNTVLYCSGFHISFNPCPRDTKWAETALVLETEDDMNEYYILNGDWRNEYEKLAPLGWDACFKFFKDNEEDFKAEMGSLEDMKLTIKLEMEDELADILELLRRNQDEN